MKTLKNSITILALVFSSSVALGKTVEMTRITCTEVTIDHTGKTVEEGRIYVIDQTSTEGRKADGTIEELDGKDFLTSRKFKISEETPEVPSQLLVFNGVLGINPTKDYIAKLIKESKPQLGFPKAGVMDRIRVGRTDLEISFKHEISDQDRDVVIVRTMDLEHSGFTTVRNGEATENGAWLRCEKPDTYEVEVVEEQPVLENESAELQEGVDEFETDTET